MSFNHHIFFLNSKAILILFAVRKLDITDSLKKIKKCMEFMKSLMRLYIELLDVLLLCLLFVFERRVTHHKTCDKSIISEFRAAISGCYKVFSSASWLLRSSKGQRWESSFWSMAVLPGAPDGAAIHHYLGKMSIQEKTKSFWEEYWHLLDKLA